MSLSKPQIDWLQEVSGLAIVKQRADSKREKKNGLANERNAKVGNAKESIKRKLSAASYKNGVFSSVKVLDEKGGQQAEFDYSDLKGDRQFEQQYLVMMQDAMEQISEAVAAMRDEKVPVVYQPTGKEVKDKDGKLRTAEGYIVDGNNLRDENGDIVMEPLYTDEEIAEEVYMPLVRERVMPEWLVPNKWSKTQQMLDASDKLYKDRLIEYTAELDEEDQSLLDAGKDATTQLGALAQKAAAMVPGGEAAGTIIGLVTLGTTTLITGVQAISKGKLTNSLNGVIDNVGKILAESVTLATGDKDAGKAAATLFTAAATGSKMAVSLLQTPPDKAGAINIFAEGLGAALGASLEGAHVDPGVTKIASSVATQVFKRIANAINIVEHVANGDSEAVIAELTTAGKETVKAVQEIVTQELSKGKSESGKKKFEKSQEELTDQILKGIDLAALGISTGKKIVDAVKKRSIDGMAEEIVNGVGDVLTGTLKIAAPAVANEIGNAYRAVTKTTLVAYYLTMDPPDQANALNSLGKGFEAAFKLAGDESSSKALETVGSAVSSAFVAAASTVDLGKAIADGKYNDAAKALSKLARTVLGKALNADMSGDPSVTAEGEQGNELIEGIEKGIGTFEKISGEVAKALEGLKDPKVKAKLQKQLDDIETAEALADIEDAKDEVERILIQGDGGGEAAADTRSIEVLIQAMKRDRMIMEMALKLVSGGVSVVQHFVAPMAAAGAAIKLAANLIKAAERATTLNTWINNQKDMHKAVSSFESSAANFVKNQGEQFSHYAIQAALELARMIGEIVACSGIATAAGQALAKGSALALAAEDIAYQFYKKADLENAWRITRKAWAHPESRKLGLLARKLNPTLAKYTLAWGATVKRDALAQEAMRSCGLNALTLSQKDSNVGKVQEYLETCFNEDNVVLKRYTLPDWMPAVVELTAKSWATAKSRGETLGEVQPIDAGGVDEALCQIGVLQKDFQTKVDVIESLGYVQAKRQGLYDELDALRKSYEQAAEHFSKELLRYHPTDKKGERHKEMEALVLEYRLAAEEATGDIDAVWQHHAEMLAKIELKEKVALDGEGSEQPQEKQTATV
ncbi:hypothetical protein SNE35_15890 [Paucibacter sp. R3-3]|uniref:Uncharacterized protein n=1 Tax=Roseateles agri TaxID=3098619 RepID=A0ABU5DI85_9BURK|nr:hypothetical protein [Paucibacter sp. R3-3]MDY0746003.1 hypothetical protein [Paucibacter sp. R3-3]